MPRLTTVSLSREVLGLLALLLAACAAEPRHVGLRLLAPEELSCRATELSHLRVEPRGDYPASERPSVTVVAGGAPVTTDLFAPQTELLLVFAEGLVRNAAGSTTPWSGGGRAPVDGRDETRVPLLPFGRSCLVSDATARVPEGAVALGLDDGRLLVAGGHREGAALATVTLVTPGEPLADAETLRLFSPRTAAAALQLGEWVLVVGGSASEQGGALDAIEALRVTRGDEARVGQGFLVEARRQPTVVAAGPDTLLVFGGEREGVALSSAERVRLFDDGSGIESERLEGAVLPRWGARALTLDDGTVIVAGGRDADGPVSAIERLEDGQLRALGGAAPVEGAMWVTLPGARFARVSPDGEMRVWLDRGETSESLGSIAPALFDAVAHAEADGRVLVAGLDAGSRPFAQLFDPGAEQEAQPVTLSRVPSVIVPLPDGTLALGDAERLALLRLDLASALDDPPTTIFAARPGQERFVVLDSASRWAPQEGVLLARRAGARWDIPRSRFADVSVTLAHVGAIELLLCPEGAPCLAVSIDASSVSHAGCRLARGEGALTLVRRAARLVVGDSGECPIALSGRVSIAIRAAEGAGVESIVVERL